MENSGVQSIDLKVVLHRTVSGGYGDLVTRRTGHAVRYGVEEHLGETDAKQVAVIDFSHVRCLEFSCADEIVGKLLLTHGRGRHFLLRGVSRGQQDAIEPVLERYGLAVVAEDRSGSLRVLGRVSEGARRAFELMTQHGGAAVEDMIGQLELSHAAAREAIDELIERRLALCHATGNGVVSLA